ncbi:transcription factor PIF1-like protein [Corchorus olitorius]|uniref:Transcription factor PIF1-like protein n=1 Tax=Corchorus olitorius TaxID=93759 RepID=A0A1R3HG85_9ROSI|nr:transcription factor PIF1-like protein [Corchorus olitorius]
MAGISHLWTDKEIDKGLQWSTKRNPKAQIHDMKYDGRAKIRLRRKLRILQELI